MGWAANPARKQETMFTLGIVQMGQRVYIPSLGRFLQADPVEGGTSNAYVYVQDPINFDDYNGMWGVPTWARWVAGAVALVAIVIVVVVISPIATLGALATTAVLAVAGAVAGTGISIAARGKVDASTAFHAALGVMSAFTLWAGAALANSIMSSSSTTQSATTTTAQSATTVAEKGPLISTSAANLKVDLFIRQVQSYGSELGDAKIVRLKTIGDPLFQGPWDKWQYSQKLIDGGNLIAHWFENSETGEILQLKLK